MELSEIIRQKIKRYGPVSFHDFMDMALYYPGLGYYTSDKEKIGVHGDFYTSSTLGPAFGAMIGKQLEEMWRLSGKKNFVIVEYGAGTGALCRDILNYLKPNHKMYGGLHYAIIEKSPAMRELEKNSLDNNDNKTGWYDSIQELGNVDGCILSNELVDNFPVHQVVMKDELMEVFVDDEDGFVELLRPAGKALKNYFTELKVRLPSGFRTEINLGAIKWIKDVSSSLRKGYVITIDYGNTSDRLYNSPRCEGTLLCYHKHQINDQPYKNIGKQDITAHVNFSALGHWGQKHGLSSCGLASQAQFLLSLGLIDYLQKTAATAGNIAQLATKRAMLIHKLLLDMGNRYMVLIQQKGVPGKELSGLKLS